ncbi:hypothetical protein F7725_026988 [Dissostichus mawsoni]|uniref:Uncharacterized protein n=1 Tax=Dissostichus mawsoni TaxID=36200 RepID=A0A7J5X927_DISMA|nr:hypothetical protein F7725_026988 [Dissostichus mawsoni]
MALAGYLHPPPPPPLPGHPLLHLAVVSSGMEEIRTGGLMEGLCPNLIHLDKPRPRCSGGFPLTPSPDPGHMKKKG